MIRRLAHLSDPHWGRRWSPGAADALHTFLRNLRPDLVAVSGDLTQRAKPREFAAARRALDGLGAPVLAVPGNHDIPLYRLHERLLDPLGPWRRHFHPDPEPSHTDDGLAVFGLCSAHACTLTEGRVTAAQAVRLERALEGTRPEQFVVILLHHPLLHADLTDRDRTLRGAERLVQIFARRRVDLVLSGHYHHRMVLNLQEAWPALPRPVPQVFAPTACTVRGRKKDRGRTGLVTVEVERAGFTVAFHYLEGREYRREASHSFERSPHGQGRHLAP